MSTWAVFAVLAVAVTMVQGAVGLGLGLAPFLVLGFLLADTVRQHVDAGRTRAAVLSVCAASAMAPVAQCVRMSRGAAPGPAVSDR